MGRLSSAPGGEISATVEMRLPLTPPPGVQQPKIWEGWSVALSRNVDRAVGSAPHRLRYPCRILRIRPADGGMYRVSARIPPWVPSAVYDLGISGPGFDDLSEASVRVRAKGDPEADRCVMTVAIPAGWTGASVSIAGEERTPLDVAWTGAFPESGSGPRVLVFEGGSPGACREEIESIVVRETEPGPSVEAVISVSPAVVAIDPVKWYSLHLEGVDRARTPAVVWDFGDGDRGEGLRVRHRWMFVEEARVRAFVFSPTGEVRVSSKTFPISRPLSRARGCGCGEADGGGRASRERGVFFGRLFQIILSAFDGGE